MFSRGVVDGAEINGFALNGGNFVQDAAASNAVTFGQAARATRRLVSSGASAVAFGGTMRVVIRGIKAKNTVTFGGTAKATRRLVATAADGAAADGTATGIRRVRTIISDAASADGTMIFSIAWSRLTEIRRVMRVRDYRSMRAQPEGRTFMLPRREGPMIVPAAAGDMP